MYIYIYTVWAANAVVGWLQMTLPSTHNNVSVFYGHKKKNAVVGWLQLNMYLLLELTLLLEIGRYIFDKSVFFIIKFNINFWN